MCMHIYIEVSLNSLSHKSTVSVSLSFPHTKKALCLSFPGSLSSWSCAQYSAPFLFRVPSRFGVKWSIWPETLQGHFSLLETWKRMAVAAACSWGRRWLAAWHPGIMSWIAGLRRTKNAWAWYWNKDVYFTIGLLKKRNKWKIIFFSFSFKKSDKMAMKTVVSEARDVRRNEDLRERNICEHTHVLSKLLAQMYTDVHTAHAYSG